MDKFERQEILEEFLVRTQGGRTVNLIVEELKSRGKNQDDVNACAAIFARWLRSGRPWSDVINMRAATKKTSGKKVRR